MAKSLTQKKETKKTVAAAPAAYRRGRDNGYTRSRAIQTASTPTPKTISTMLIRNKVEVTPGGQVRE